MDTLNPIAFFLLLAIPLAVYHGLRTAEDATTGRRVWMVILRSLVILLITLDLAEVRVWTRGQKLCAYFLVDTSRSIRPDAREAMVKYIGDCIQQMSRRASAGLITFDSQARLVMPAARRPEFITVTEDMENALKPNDDPRGQTNIADAIRVALSVYPDGVEKRAILLTDGNETEGNVEAAALMAKGQGVSLFTVPVPPPEAKDVLVSRLDIPTEAKAEVSFPVVAQVVSSHPCEGTLKLFADGFKLAEQQVKLAEGANTVKFRQSLAEPGRFLYCAKFEAPFKQRLENDRAYGFVRVRGMPRVLLLTGQREDGKYLEDALRATRMIVESRQAAGVPERLLDLLNYDVVIMAGITADQLSDNQMRLLREYVYEFGGGFVMVGGDKGFGAGGFAGTDLEQMLPVKTQLLEKEVPSVAIAVIVDFSKSILQIQEGDLNKPELMATSIMYLVEKLGQNDMLGVITTGTEVYLSNWRMHLQRVVDKKSLAAQAKRLGREQEYRMGSNLYRPLLRALEQLKTVRTSYKHILLLSDGYVPTGYDYAKVCAQISSDGVTISAIGLGDDCNSRMLKQLAQWGNGRFYTLTGKDDVDKVFTQELKEVQQSIVVEEALKPRCVAQSDMLDGIDIDLAPYLFGYVRTKPKFEAETILTFPPENDPLLSVWDYGSGRAAAFTSDVKDRWAVLWVRDWQRNFGQLWEQIIYHLIARDEKLRLVPDVRTEGEEVLIETDVVDDHGNFVNGRDMLAEVYYLGKKGHVFSRAAVTRIPLDQSAPGRYRGTHRVTKNGVYAVRIADRERSAVTTAGVVVSTFKEQAGLSINRELLKRIAATTGGRYEPSPEEAMKVTRAKKTRPHEVGAWALMIAAFLFLADVIARRLPAVLELLRERRRRLGKTSH